MNMLDWWRNRRRDFTRFPRDENGDVLWQMSKTDRLSCERSVDFFFVFPGRTEADQFAACAAAIGYRTEVSWFAEKNAWDTRCSIVMLQSHAGISQRERDLTLRALPLQGQADGWGCVAQ